MKDNEMKIFKEVKGIIYDGLNSKIKVEDYNIVRDIVRLAKKSDNSDFTQAMAIGLANNMKLEKTGNGREMYLLAMIGSIFSEYLDMYNAKKPLKLPEIDITDNNINFISKITAFFEFLQKGKQSFEGASLAVKSGNEMEDKAKELFGDKVGYIFGRTLQEEIERRAEEIKTGKNMKINISEILGNLLLVQITNNRLDSGSGIMDTAKDIVKKATEGNYGKN
jgi:hypothetical protein